MNSKLLHFYNQSNFSVAIACMLPASKILKWHLISVEWVKMSSHVKLIQGPRSHLQATVTLLTVPEQSWRWHWKPHSATLKCGHHSTNFVSILRFLSFCMSWINLYIIEFFPPKNTTGKRNYLCLAEMESLQKSIKVFPIRYKQIMF